MKKKQLRAVRGKLAESLDYNDRHWLQHLLEADDAPPPPPSPTGAQGAPGQPQQLLPHDSLDAAMDEELIKADKASKNTYTESRKLSLRQLLEAADDAPADDAGGDDAGGDATPPPDPNMAATVQKPPANVEGFARELARLVQHANDMFDLPGTVLRRGLNYITKNHGQDAMTSVKRVLEQDYDVRLERNNDDQSAPDPNHFAKGAGPEVGGG